MYFWCLSPFEKTVQKLHCFQVPFIPKHAFFNANNKKRRPFRSKQILQNVERFEEEKKKEK